MTWNSGSEILTIEEMYEVDRISISSGITTLQLMENAGRQVANEIAKRWSFRKTTILCGPGNNGGDGYVIARHLAARGWPVTVTTFGDHTKLKSESAEMAAQWRGPSRPFSVSEPIHGDIFVDAIYGAGLTRGLSPELSQLFEDIKMADVPIVAVDTPSGLHGDKATFIDDVKPWSADLTVTFFRKKPAHVLFPGRGYCGEIVCADIGISGGTLHALNDQRKISGAQLACHEIVAIDLPSLPKPDIHKYLRGHCIVVSGSAASTGAARLAARAALRSGAGVVTAVGDRSALPILAASLTTIMVREAENAAALKLLLDDRRISAVVVGPGLGVGKETQNLVFNAISSTAKIVLDADALTSFAGEPDALFAALHDGCVLTPHQGEFQSLFPGLLSSSLNRVEAARQAARAARAVIVLKGADTVVAHPNGRAAVNTNAPAGLATAGSGDVLAGIIAGLLAQGMSTFEAAKAAVWLHGKCGTLAGPGLIAEDLAELLPQAMKSAPF